MICRLSPNACVHVGKVAAVGITRSALIVNLSREGRQADEVARSGYGQKYEMMTCKIVGIAADYARRHLNGGDVVIVAGVRPDGGHLLEVEGFIVRPHTDDARAYNLGRDGQGGYC